MKDFRNAVTDDRVYVFDGAMGTMLYQRGVYINRCYDELNLAGRDLVLAVQREYVKAGADIIETNTYGANRIKLSGYGLEDKAYEINHAGARIARDAAGEGLLSPEPLARLGFASNRTARTSAEEAQVIFREQAEALLEGGVDLLFSRPSPTPQKSNKRCSLFDRYRICRSSPR
jgi:homocysteine S-methyltransferase